MAAIGAINALKSSVNKNVNNSSYRPLVSIITPVRNGKKYLEQCIQSVLAQTYQNIEHVLVDGGSTDGTLEMLAKYQAKYPDRIKFITGTDKGVGDAVKKGYRVCRGEIIGWIDSDDVYEPIAVRTAVDFLGSNRNASFVYGNCDMINEKGETIACFIIKDFDLKEWINSWHYIVFCAAFYKREVIDKVGYLNNLGNDLDFYLRVNKKFKLFRIEGRLTGWRLNSEGISLKKACREDKIRKQRVREDFFLLLKYRGSLLSPRALTFYMSLKSSAANILRPYLGFTYPLLNKMFRPLMDWMLWR